MFGASPRKEREKGKEEKTMKKTVPILTPSRE